MWSALSSTDMFRLHGLHNPLPDKAMAAVNCPATLLRELGLLALVGTACSQSLLRAVCFAHLAGTPPAAR